MKKETVETFEKLYLQSQNLYEEISILSKKTPDGPINKFKLKLINQVLTTANELLQNGYHPFSTFEQFCEDDMPTYSDIIIILSQYVKCLEKFKVEHVRYDNISIKWFWCLDDSEEKIKTTAPPHYLIR